MKGEGWTRCRPLHLQWIDNKVLLYNTEYYIQSAGINQNGKEYFKKECIYVFNSHFAVEQRLAQDCKSTIPQLKNKGKKAG